MILFLGDSTAVGTPLAAYTHERVVKRAEVGIGTREAVGRFLHPLDGARVVVVSLGANDTRPREVGQQARRVRHDVAGRCLLWVEVAGVPRAAAINRAIRRAGVELVPWHSRRLHPTPAGYRVRAQRIARYARRCS